MLNTVMRLSERSDGLWKTSYQIKSENFQGMCNNFYLMTLNTVGAHTYMSLICNLRPNF